MVPVIFIRARWTPGIVSLSKQAWIGYQLSQIRYIDEEMIGRMHICTKFVDTYNYHSIGVEHRGKISRREILLGAMKFVDTHNYQLIGLEHRGKISRREILLATTGIGGAFSLVDSTSAGQYPSMEELLVTRYYKTPSGVKIEDIVEGNGLPAREGDMVELNYVCRRSNGYFVYSTVDQLSGESKPVTVSLGDKQIISGLKEVLVGMKAGGKRRAFIPPNVGYTSENLEPQPPEFGPRRSLLSHMKEPLVFEVQVLKVL